MTPTTRNPDAGFRPQRMGQRSSSSRGILVVHSDEMPTEHHLPLPTGNSVVHQSGQRPPCLPLCQGAISLCMQTKPSGARVVINSLWVVPVRTGQFHCALVSAPLWGRGAWPTQEKVGFGHPWAAGTREGRGDAMGSPPAL